MQDEYEMYKIVVIGSSGTGKTNISTKYIRDSFTQTNQATLGVEFLTKIVQHNGRSIKISLWDTAGQQRYKALSKVYYKGASGVIVVYDITDAKSYLDIQSWMKLVNENLNVDDLIIMVVGNKTDLQSQRQVPAERAVHQFQDTYGIDCWEVSAKSGHNIQQLFSDMVKKIIQKANDVKSTMYRGTVDYESERGTYLRQETKTEAGKVHNNVHNAPRHESIILEQEEDVKSNAAELQRMEGGTIVPKHTEVLNRLTLSVSMQRQSLIDNQDRRKKNKCC